jgi:3-deoxy-D-manno-octulosonic-acid transferase
VSRRRRPPPLALYALGARLLEPLAPRLLAARARRGKEAPDRLGERLGRASAPRPVGPLVWLHAVSVGESLSLLPLIEALRHERPSLAILVTSGTRTSAELLAQRLPAGVTHQFAPIDGPGAVARFLDHWRPDAGLFVESELWPNLILAAAARGVRLGLLSARITQKSAAGWARAPASAKALLGAFGLVLPQDAASAARLQSLGARVGPELNLKRAGSAPPCDHAELERLETVFAGRRVVLAASTHPGEEALIAAAWRAARPDLLVLVPRHPQRGGEVAEALRRDGLAVARRTAGEPPPPAPGVYLADTLGELGLFLRLAGVVVMGGGFAPSVGGHNPLEAARLGCAILTGPDVANARAIYDEMAAAGAAVVVADQPALQAELSRLADAPDASAELGRRALAYAGQQSGRLAAALQAILELVSG